MSATITTLPGSPRAGIQFGNRIMYLWEITFDSLDVYPSAGIDLGTDIASQGYSHIGQMIINNAKGMNDNLTLWIPVGAGWNSASHVFNWTASTQLLKINGNDYSGVNGGKKIQAGALLVNLTLQVEAYTQPLSGE